MTKQCLQIHYKRNDTMCFVGRKKEIKLIIKALEQKKNIVLSGKYGIGRTTLIKHVAKVAQERWRFCYIDFSQTPGELCHTLLKKLMPDYHVRNRYKYEHYKRTRFQLTHLDFPDKRKHILILDNIAKLSPQKIDLLNYLSEENRFGFIAVVEQFVPEPDLLRLRVALNPAILLNLSYLSIQNTQEYFRQCSVKYNLHWTVDSIKWFSEIFRGYPLSMREFVDMERKRGSVKKTTDEISNRA